MSLLTAGEGESDTHIASKQVKRHDTDTAVARAIAQIHYGKWSKEPSSEKSKPQDKSTSAIHLLKGGQTSFIT